MNKKIKIAVAQMNPHVGDFSANTEKILAWITLAEKNEADMVVFPEMSLCGYPVWDLANQKAFVDEGQRHLKKIVSFTRKKRVAVILGFIQPSGFANHRHYNAGDFIIGGKVYWTQHKRLLPTYDVFLEDIFFSQGQSIKVIPFRGLRIGMTICEDIWDSEYPVKPVQDLVSKGADFIINLSASPFYRGVLSKRLDVIRRHAQKHGAPILYVNQVGSQDDLIFDGRSLLVSGSGEVLFQAPAFEEGIYFYDYLPRITPQTTESHLSQDEDIALVYEALVLGVRDYCKKNGFHRVCLGLSGGIDSALVAAIATDALGADAVLGVSMPGPYSSKGSWEDAEVLAKNLGIHFSIHPIKQTYQATLNAYRRQYRKAGFEFPEKGKLNLAMENLQARLRGLTLMYLSNDQGRLLLTTGNKSELAMGYCTLYGDMAGGLAVIADVYKTDVYRLARFRNQIKEVIPRNTLVKPPSAELRPNQKDQDSLPPYEVLDQILYFYIEKNKSAEEISRLMKKTGVSSVLIRGVIRKVNQNEYKRRQTPPVLRVTEKAWFGRRMPITNRFHG